MNKKQIIDIVQEYVTFEILTANYKSPRLNLNKIDFLGDNLIKIVEDSQKDVYIQTKDVIIVRGVGKI